MVRNTMSEGERNATGELTGKCLVPHLPETALNREFFTHVAGDTVQDVKSLLSKGYSLQFLVENEDGSSALVDVLSTAAADHIPSAQQQQLVIMASGKVPETLPLALQGILPSSVPIVPSVAGSNSPQSPALEPSPLNTPSQVALTEVSPTSSSGNESDTPPRNLLPSVSDTGTSYEDILPFTNGSSVDKGLSLGESVPYALSSLSLPLVEDDSSSSEYILDSLHADSDKAVLVTAAANVAAPVKLLDQCLSGELRDDMMSFSFEEPDLTANPILNSPGENQDCSAGLTKDFSDLIAADADNCNVTLTIQPQEGRSSVKDVTLTSAYTKNDKEGLQTALDWMEGDELSLSSQPLPEKLPNEQSGPAHISGPCSVSPSYADNTLTHYNIALQGPSGEVAPDADLAADLDGLLLSTADNALPEPSEQAPGPLDTMQEESAEPGINKEQHFAEPTERSLISAGPLFICDICNRSLKTASCLYRHLRKHTGEFTCVACHCVFARKENLKLHRCAAQPDHSSSNDVALPFKCAFCPRCFATKRAVSRHLRTHTGVRKHHCKNCGQSFATKKAITSHMGSCSGTPPTSSTRSPPSDAVGTTTDTVDPATVAFVLSDEEEEMQQEQGGREAKPKHLNCATCNRLFLSKISLRRHQLRTKHVVQTTNCTLCSRSFPLVSPKLVEAHTRYCSPAHALQTGKASVAVCPECQEPFRELVLYRQHIFRHTHPLQCAHCLRSFSCLEDRGQHLCTGHWEKCRQCDHRFTTVPQLERHLVSHGVPAHHCFECGHSFHQQEDFSHHWCFELRRKFSSGSMPDTTPSSSSTAVSSTSTSRKDNRRRSEESLMCEVCGEMCKSGISLRAHRALHGERKFACDVCGKRFFRKDVLTEHMYVHQDAQLPCTKCNKLLKSKKSLEVHMRQHLCAPKFACQLCSKAFHQKVNMTKHMLSCHGPRATERCQQCGRRCATAEALARHQLEHQEEPQHACPQCPRAFRKENLLQKHIKYYHSTGSYFCPVCSYNSKNQPSLHRHVLKQHPEMMVPANSPVVTSSGAALTANTSALVVPGPTEVPIEAPEGAELLLPASPEVLLTVSELQLTTDGMQLTNGALQEFTFATDATVEGADCLLEEGSLVPPDDMVLYVLQQAPLQDPSA